MKKIILIMLMALSACGTPDMLDYSNESPKVNETVEVTPGQVFYFKEFMKGEKAMTGPKIFWGSNGRSELSVVSVGPDKISLNYRRYYKPLSAYDGFEVADDWRSKINAVQKYDFDLKKSKKFSFKDLQFEILSVTDSGSIKYKRIK